jgi:hypothetical protein
MECNLCKKKATSTCGGCSKRVYCSEKCQIKDWINHKPECIDYSISYKLYLQKKTSEQTWDEIDKYTDGSVEKLIMDLNDFNMDSYNMFDKFQSEMTIEKQTSALVLLLKNFSVEKRYGISMTTLFELACEKNANETVRLLLLSGYNNKKTILSALNNAYFKYSNMKVVQTILKETYSSLQINLKKKRQIEKIPYIIVSFHKNIKAYVITVVAPDNSFRSVFFEEYFNNLVDIKLKVFLDGNVHLDAFYVYARTAESATKEERELFRGFGKEILLEVISIIYKLDLINMEKNTLSSEVVAGDKRLINYYMNTYGLKIMNDSTKKITKMQGKLSDLNNIN